METASNNELIKQIQRYQHNIQQVDPAESDPQRVLHYIRKLSRLPIRFHELEKTGVGKTINALRKRPGNIGEEATLLVAKWKAIAKKQVQEEEESVGSQGKRSDADSHSDYESPGSDTKSNVSKENKKIRIEVQKNQSDKSVREIKLKSSKHSEKHNPSKDSINRKRKHSSESRDKSEKSEKYLKLESFDLGAELNSYSIEKPIKKEPKVSNSVKSEEKHDSDKKKKKEKEKQQAEKSHKKEHDNKKHHKSSKHKDDKAHRHHSKSSHTEKKRESSKPEVEKHRSDKKSDSKSRRDSEKKSSSGSRKDSKSSSKYYSPVEPSASQINDQDSDRSEDYDISSVKMENTQADDDFGAALLGISQATVSPIKKKSTPSKYSSVHSSPASASPQNSGSEFDMFPGSVKLEPLEDLDLDKLKEDSYISKEDYIREKTSSRLKYLSEEDALNSMTTTKNQRTKVFSGLKSKFTVKFPSLFELCVRVLQDNFDALEYTGGVPYDVLKPIMEKVTVEQLYTFENYNPYLIGETDELWEYHCKRHFRTAKRQELETWRDVYLRCVEEREEKLQSLTENISQSIANSTPVRKTKLAYCDTTVKPPRNVARSQAKHGTGHVGMKRSPKGAQPSAAAVQSVKERLAKESMAAPMALSAPSKNLLAKKKKAPLMQKTLQLFKGLKR